MDRSLEPFLQFALDAAWQAGRITLGYFQTQLTPDKKADNTPVTIADRTAEQKLRELIGRYWPAHGIIGEEFGQSAGSAPLTWIIDPIDGTKSFVQGVPLYGVLIALTDGTSPLVGVAQFPALNETVYAAHGHGCFWNGRRVHVSAVSDLRQAVLLASEGDMTNSLRAEEWQRLVKATYIQRTWGDSYGYALVATGRAEIMVDAVMNIWDCAPFQVILEEAGGTFTDWKGTPRIDGGESIATNGQLFEAVMGLVRPAR
jgi:histidinol phosphatase-like enzyme (inositol monophosphatase family)